MKTMAEKYKIKSGEMPIIQYDKTEEYYLDERIEEAFKNTIQKISDYYWVCEMEPELQTDTYGSEVSVQLNGSDKIDIEADDWLEQFMDYLLDEFKPKVDMVSTTSTDSAEESTKTPAHKVFSDD